MHAIEVILHKDVILNSWRYELFGIEISFINKSLQYDV